VLAEQPVRVRRGNQLELEQRGDHVVAALRRLFFGDLRLLRLQMALHLQEAQQREVRVVCGDVLGRSAPEDDLQQPTALEMEPGPSGRVGQRSERIEADRRELREVAGIRHLELLRCTPNHRRLPLRRRLGRRRRLLRRCLRGPAICAVSSPMPKAAAIALLMRGPAAGSGAVRSILRAGVSRPRSSGKSAPGSHSFPSSDASHLSVSCPRRRSRAEMVYGPQIRPCSVRTQ